MRQNQSLHPLVRNATILYEPISAVGETFAIRAGFNLINRGIAAAIGAGYSSMSQALSPVMDAYNIPVCDGSSTSPALSSKAAYPNYFRAVPEDNFQAQVMVNLLIQQGWTEVAIVATQDSYGQNLANEVAAQVAAKNMTVTLRENFFFESPNYVQIANNVKDSLSRIIIYCGHQQAFTDLAAAAQSVGIFGQGYAWITSDSVKLASSFPPSQLQYINGIINVFPQEGRGKLYDEFLAMWSKADPAIYSQRGTIQPYSLFYVNCLELFVFGFDRLLKQRPDLTPTGNQPWNLSVKIPADFSFPNMDTLTGPVVFSKHGIGFLFENL
ncbi:hypothetical protein HDU96_008841 [Phlyctochytrium bullatum]|nr:hypothetical protein HDU96_008841 [Phlyctochytrium bullatum]